MTPEPTYFRSLDPVRPTVDSRPPAADLEHANKTKVVVAYSAALLAATAPAANRDDVLRAWRVGKLLGHDALTTENHLRRARTWRGLVELASGTPGPNPCSSGNAQQRAAWAVVMARQSLNHLRLAVGDLAVCWPTGITDDSLGNVDELRRGEGELPPPCVVDEAIAFAEQFSSNLDTGRRASFGGGL